MKSSSIFQTILIAVFGAVAIAAVLIFALNSVADALRDALDPRRTAL